MFLKGQKAAAVSLSFFFEDGRTIIIFFAGIGMKYENNDCVKFHLKRIRMNSFGINETDACSSK